MNIDFAEFNKIPALRAKRDTLDKAIEAESEVIQVTFRQNRNYARAIIERIDTVYDKRNECWEHLSQHENPRWYKSYWTYIGVGGVISVFANDRGLWALGAVILLFCAGWSFRSLIERNHYCREKDDADRAYEALEFRWRSLGNFSTIYYCIFHNEQERLDKQNPMPKREAYLEVWSHTANEWLNAERHILNELTQRHFPYDSGWENELDISREDYFEKIEKLRADERSTA